MNQASLNAGPLPSGEIAAFRRIGRVVAVTGAHAMILLDADEGLPGVTALKGPEIGTLLKVDTEPSIALALVSAMSSPMPSARTTAPSVYTPEKTCAMAVVDTSWHAPGSSMGTGAPPMTMSPAPTPASADSTTSSMAP